MTRSAAMETKNSEDEEEVERLVIELQALRDEVELVKQQTAEDLEKTILDYEEKLEAMKCQTSQSEQVVAADRKQSAEDNGEVDDLKTKLDIANEKINKLSAEIELANRNAEQLSCALDASNQMVTETKSELQRLQAEKSELQKKLAETEKELVTYQADLEQTLATQEEEIERSEELLHKIDELTSENEQLTVSVTN